MRRQLARHIPTQLAKLPIEAVADGFQFEHAARQHPILAFEAQRQAEVEQLQQSQVLGWIATEAFEQQKELLAAKGLVVKAAQQAELRPVTGIAPGGGDHRLVDRGAKGIAGGHDLTAVQPAGQGTLCEQPQAGGQALLEHMQVFHGVTLAQAHHLGEQWRGSAYHGIDAQIQGLARSQACRLDHAFLQLGVAWWLGKVGERAARCVRPLGVATEHHGPVVPACVGCGLHA